MASLQATAWVVWGVGTLGLVLTAATLFGEGEGRAGQRVVALGVPGALLWATVLLCGSPAAVFGLTTTAAVVLLTLGGHILAGMARYRGRGPAQTQLAASALGVGRRADRPDERDTVFARMSWAPDGPAFAGYYRRNPSRLETDQGLRALPGLCAPGSATFHPEVSRVPPAVFDLIAGWHHLIVAREGRAGLGGEGKAPDPDGRMLVTERVKGLAQLWGALDVGVAPLDPAFVYSHVGRREAEYGHPVRLDHPYAVVFTVEMDHRLVRSAPGLGTTVESSSRYLEAAKIALALSSVIRAWGYDARPHLDGNYLAVLPPLAVRAGLGEVGRSGLLVTEECGPRVRLGAVRTDLPLVPDGPRPFGVQEFCRVCLKCARACPGRAIGTQRDAPPSGWAIRWEDCYRFWRKVGTDCAVCLDVCPYSKPRSRLHRLFRLAVRGSPLGPRTAVWLDDFLYARRPRRQPEPDWLGLRRTSRGGRRVSEGRLGRPEALE